jgi:hypothetical protein
MLLDRLGRLRNTSPESHWAVRPSGDDRYRDELAWDASVGADVEDEDAVTSPARAVPPLPMAGTSASSLRRHPFLIVLPTLLLLAAGIIAGNKRPLTYTAAATINVGKSDIATQATPGYVTAAEALATTYSRLVSSHYVTVPAGLATKQSASTAASHLTGAPIPSEPTFTVTATGSSSNAAVGLNRAAISALRRYVSRNASQQGGPKQLLAKYNAAQTRADQLRLTSQTLSDRFSATRTSTLGTTTTNPPGTTGPNVTQAQVTQAKVAAQAAALQAQALSNQYLNLAGTAVAPTLDVLTTPDGTATSNRTQNIEKYGIIGGVAGLIVGVAFAALVSGIETSRARRRVGWLA